MPWGLHRYQDTGHLHFITFSCYRRRQRLDPPRRRRFERALERARINYGFIVVGYVVMPEHVHLLVGEPERDGAATAIKAMKQSVARQDGGRFWQERYYDFNVWSRRKRIEKLRYMHRNPVKRGLVEKPEDWEWSSDRHYLTGDRDVVEIESEWTAYRRGRMGITAGGPPFRFWFYACTTLTVGAPPPNVRGGFQRVGIRNLNLSRGCPTHRADS